MFVKNEVSLWHRYPNDGWALGTHKSDDPGQIIATLIHYLHLCTHKYLEISNNNTPGLYSNRVKHRNGTAGQSVPAMQHHVSETLADRCPIFGCLSFNIQPL